MATTLNVTEKPGRTDVFALNPFDVEVRNDLRGRRKPPSHDDVVHRAISFLQEVDGQLVGQIEPVVCRKIEDHKLLLTLGYTRTAAARLIREGFTYTDPDTGEKKTFKDENWKLKVIVRDSNDKMAFLQNVAENAQRKATTPMDDAINQDRMRTAYGMTDAEIARWYSYPEASKVSRLKNLLRLNPEEQDLVDAGALSIQGALDLLELPEDERAKAIEAAKTASGKINGSALRSYVREHILSDDAKLEAEANGDGDEDNAEGELVGAGVPATSAEGAVGDLDFLTETPGVIPMQTPAVGTNGNAKSKPAAPKGKKPDQKSMARTMRDLRVFFDSLGDEDGVDPAIERFAKDFLTWASGKTTDKAMVNALNRLLDAKRGK